MLPLMLKRKTQKQNGECDDEKGKQGAPQQQRQRQQLGTTDDAFRGGDYELRGRPDVRGCGGAEESIPSGQGGGSAYGRGLLHSDVYYDHCDRRRRTPSPVGSGEWALRECEAFTTWVNDIRRHQGLPPVDDIRLAVADGTTIVNLTEVVTNSKVTSVEHEGHLSRPQALVNLDRCLAHLAAHGVDVIGIQASDLAQGDLKASLQLLGKLRRQYDGLRLSPGSRTKGDGDQAAALKEPTLTLRAPSPCRLDHSLIMPGRVTTSPQLHRPVPVHMRDTSLPVQSRNVTALEASRVVPGMMSTEGPMYRPQPAFADHSATLNKDRNVYGHIHRQDERSLHDNDTHLATGKTASGPRPPSNPTGVSSGVPPERPPTTLGVAWAAGPTLKQLPVESGIKSPASSLGVEERLRKLLLDSDRPAVPSAQQFYDGELLLPPPPPRSYGDGATLGATADAGMRERVPPDQGYVPSRPSERYQGPRGEVLMKREPSRTGNPSYPRQPAPQPPGQMAILNYLPEPRILSIPGASQQSDQKASDMRSTWNKLFGTQPEWRQPARPQDAASGTRRRESRDEGDSHLNRPDETTTWKKDSSFTNPHQLAARESPMGQSSSTPGQTPGSSSHRSSYSVGHVTFSTFKPETDNDGSEDEVELKMLGPASKYPEPSGSRPSSTRLTPQTLKSEPQGARDMVPVSGSRTSGAVRSESSTPAPPTTRDVSSRSSARPPSRLVGPLGVGLPARSPGGPVVNDAFVSDSGDEHMYGGSTDRLHADDSIFDLHDQARLGAPSESSSSRSVTPPLPPLSPTSSQPESTSSTFPQPALNRFFAFGPPSRAGGQALSSQKGTDVPSVARTPDLLVTSLTPGSAVNGGRSVTEGRGATTGQQTGRVTGSAGLRGPPAHGALTKMSVPTIDGVDGSRQFVRSQSLDDVRETCSESNNLSFDVDNTFLMVEPSELSDTDTLVSRDARSLRGQLQKLESMYHDVLRKVGGDQGAHTRGGRRWSIASSDTSSFKKGRHLRAPSSTLHRPGVSRDLKSFNKRFQRLESHVVTLARSIAHVSSELRAHNSLCRDVDLLKRELRELKQKGAAAPPESPRDVVTPFDKFRGWIPSLTNPKRINKLTQFFGQEPPLLEIFLKKLGYERYVKNFEAEHIGMIELPYMTEERLQCLGIPMGPRLRILQESQLCFRQENFDIYIV